MLSAWKFSLFATSTILILQAEEETSLRLLWPSTLATMIGSWLGGVSKTQAEETFSMRPAITRDHQQFFSQHGWIAFEDVLSPDRTALMLQTLLAAESERLQTTPLRLSEKAPTELYAAGTDLWRTHSGVKALAADLGWAGMLGELLDVRVLRLAGDQLWLWRPGRWSPQFIPFATLNRPWLSLSQIVSCDGLLAGVFFSLEGGSETSVKPTLPLNPFGPNGGAVIVKADLPLSLDMFQGLSQASYCVLVAGKHCHYRPAPLDPAPHRLKAFGYIPGQPMTEKSHPLLWTA